MNHDTELTAYTSNDTQGSGEIRHLTDEEALSALNLPERDKERYPLPTKEEMEEAGSFMFKLNLMAGSVDLNLQSLVWELYINMNRFLNKNEENSSIMLAHTLEDLREYIANSNNPIFGDVAGTNP